VAAGSAAGPVRHARRSRPLSPAFETEAWTVIAGIVNIRARKLIAN
jgi:hypothetical protein